MAVMHEDRLPCAVEFAWKAIVSCILRPDPLGKTGLWRLARQSQPSSAGRHYSARWDRPTAWRWPARCTGLPSSRGRRSFPAAIPAAKSIWWWKEPFVSPSSRSDGRTLSFKHANAGEIFGEIACLDGGARSADATAITPCRRHDPGAGAAQQLDRDEPPRRAGRDNLPVPAPARHQRAVRGDCPASDRGQACPVLPVQMQTSRRRWRAATGHRSISACRRTNWRCSSAPAGRRSTRRWRSLKKEVRSSAPAIGSAATLPGSSALRRQLEHLLYRLWKRWEAPFSCPRNMVMSVT